MRAGRRRHRRQRRHHHAGAQRAEEHRHQAWRHAPGQHDGVTGAQAVALQRSRDAVHQLVQFRPAEALVAHHQRRPIRPGTGVVSDQRTDRAEVLCTHFAASPSRSISALSLAKVSCAQAR
jgi:hypothetical protein